MQETSPAGQKIKAEKKRRDPRRITETYLHNSALYYLQRFATSTAHFRTVMARKIDRSCEFHKDQNKQDCLALLDTLILKFQDTGLLNDAVYTRGMVQSLRRRGSSSRMIHARLSAKGLGNALIGDAIQAHAGDCADGEDGRNAELDAAIRLARRKRIGPYAQDKNPDEKTCRKWLSMMARAGFSYDMAKNILAMDEDV